MEQKKRKYEKPKMEIFELATQGCLLKGSVETKIIEFKGHTEDYETESFNWDNISFE